MIFNSQSLKSRRRGLRLQNSKLKLVLSLQTLIRHVQPISVSAVINDVTDEIDRIDDSATCTTSTTILELTDVHGWLIRIRKRGHCYGNMDGWVAGWVSVCHTPVLYQNGQTYLKTFWYSGNPIILVFWPWRQYQIPRVTHSVGAQNTRSGEKLAICDGNLRLSQKRCEIGRWLLWDINRKSWVPNRMVSFSMTLSDPKPGFYGHCILTI